MCKKDDYYWAEEVGFWDKGGVPFSVVCIVAFLIFWGVAGYFASSL